MEPCLQEVVEVEPILELLAIEINEEHRAVEEAAVSALEHALRAGELLSEAKEQVGYGGWLPWLERNFKGSTRTAQGYMRLWRNRDRLGDAQRVAHLSIRHALDILATPKPPPPPEIEAAVRSALFRLRDPVEREELGLPDRDEQRERLEMKSEVRREASALTDAVEFSNLIRAMHHRLPRLDAEELARGLTPSASHVEQVRQVRDFLDDYLGAIERKT